MTPNEYQDAAFRTESPPPADLDKAGVQRHRLLHAGMGFCTEAGEFQDGLKRAIFYGKPLDTTNVKEECGDILWYVALALDAIDCSMEECMVANIAKLKARYPQKFDAESAVNRNLDAERAALESTQK